MGEDRLLTLAEASEITGYTQRRLRQLAHNKTLPADLYGKTWLVKETVLNRFMETHQPARGRPKGSKNKPANS
jgi:excisionase family DNA binding protein